MIILTDSLSRPVEALSVKLGGSANGHNGVKSIISALGGEMRFYRFRLGIGAMSLTQQLTLCANFPLMNVATGPMRD
jgi:peptidyl-tRNA hydrolase, PTH1 family